MSQPLRLLEPPTRVGDAFRATIAKSVSTSTAAARGFAHRADAGGAAGATEAVTKFAVILLSSVNTAMWWLYTESRFMGTVWAMIAIVFAIWMKRDAARQ